MTKLRINHFNLVEIILAMGIIVVAMATLMGMFPLGMKTSREAVMNNYSNSYADQIGGWIETRAKLNWMSLGNIPSSKPTAATAIEGAPFDATDKDPFFKNTRATSINGIYTITSKTSANSINVEDFKAEARVWKESASVQTVKSPFTKTLDGTKATRLYIEISWPQQVPYQTRLAKGNVRTFMRTIIK